MSDFKEIVGFLEVLGDAILIANDASEIVFANSSCVKLFGYSSENMLRLRITDLMDRSLEQEHPHALKQYIHSNSPAKEMMARNTMPCVNAAGKKFHARISIAHVNIAGELFGIATIQDYTSVHEKISGLEVHSNVDALSNFYNRRYLQEILSPDNSVLNAWNAIGVLYLDLDRFKPVNDTHGHKIGDLVLTEIANRIKESVRRNDLMFRIGGDEFLVLINLTEVADKSEAVKSLGEKIYSKVNEPLLINAHSLEIGVSIGAGIYPENSNDLTELIHKADQAMYLSKNSIDAVTLVAQLPCH